FFKVSNEVAWQLSAGMRFLRLARMNSTDLQSIIGLTIQCAGIFLVAILSYFMTRSIRRPSLDYWTAGWISLSISLLSLSIGFRIPSLKNLYYPIYFFGEYLFGYLFVAGCRAYAGKPALTWRKLYLVIPAVAGAIGLSRLSPDFNVSFVPHA